MTKYVNRSSDIRDFPFQDYCSISPTEMSELGDKHGLKNLNSWMLPQILAFFGSFKVTLDDTGKLDPKALCRDNIGKDTWKIGVWRVCTQLRRSALVKAQNTEHYSMYSALVPLIMAGIKKHQDLPYSKWSRDGLEYIVEKNLHEAMTCEVPEDLTQDDIIMTREIGLSLKSNIGSSSKAISSWKLTGIKNTPMGTMPTLAVTMLSQIWVAHPSLRSKYMVLDPRDWDNMPEPLITSDIIESKESLDLPWL